MFKRYKSPYDSEGQNSGPLYGTGSTSVASEVPPRIYDGRSPAAPSPSSQVPLPDVTRETEEDDLFGDDLPQALSPRLETQEPETTVGKNVSITGELKFDRLLRIDGYFEGQLISDGKIIVGPTGVVKADIALEEAIIEGRVVGDILVERIELRCQAEVKGNITARSISVDEGVSINGQVSVTPSSSSEENNDS